MPVLSLKVKDFRKEPRVTLGASSYYRLRLAYRLRLTKIYANIRYNSSLHIVIKAIAWEMLKTNIYPSNILEVSYIRG
jgi:hypothetical protein